MPRLGKAKLTELVRAEIRAVELGVDAPRGAPGIGDAIYSQAEWEGWAIHYWGKKKHPEMTLEQETGYLARVIFIEDVWD